MHNFEPDNTENSNYINNRDSTGDAHDGNEVEIVDLGLPTRTSPAERFALWSADFFHAHGRMRGKLVSALIVLCALLVVLPTASSSAFMHRYFVITITEIPPGQPFNTVQTSPVNMAAADNRAFIVSSHGNITAFQADDGRLLWQQPLPSVALYDFLLATDSTLYTISNNGNNSIIEALRSSNGALLWKRFAPVPGPQPLQTDGNIVYVNTAEGAVLALNASNGNLLWQFATGERLPFDSKLYADDGIAAIVSDTGIVDVLSATTGKLLDRYHFVNGAWRPTVESNILYIASGEGWVEARRTSDGTLLWRSPSDNANFWSPTISNGMVFVDGGQNKMNVLRGSDGHLLWQYNISKGVAQSPVLQHGIVYLTMLDGWVVALRASNGSQLWHYQPPHRYQFFWFLPIIAGNILYLNNANGPTSTNGGNSDVQDRLYALDAISGQVLWVRPVEHPDIRYSPIVIGDVIYFAQTNGAISALGDSDGGYVWFYTPSAPILWYPQVVNGILYIQQVDGTMSAIQVNDGSILWHYPSHM